MLYENACQMRRKVAFSFMLVVSRKCKSMLTDKFGKTMDWSISRENRVLMANHHYYNSEILAAICSLVVG